jgi:hypothetical protein
MSPTLRGDEQVQAIEGALATIPVVSVILQRVPLLKLPGWYLGAGGVTGTVWNVLHGFDPTYVIKDYDLVYFDLDDLSADGEAIRAPPPLRDGCPAEQRDHRRARLQRERESMGESLATPSRSSLVGAHVTAYRQERETAERRQAVARNAGCSPRQWISDRNTVWRGWWRVED